MRDATSPKVRTLHRLPWDKVTLAPLDDADADAVHIWQNAPEIRDMTMGFRLPIQKPAVRDWIAGLRSPGAQQSRVIYAIRHDGQAVGLVHLYDMTPGQRRASLGVLIGSPDHRHLGLGVMAMALIVDFAFNGLDLRRINAEMMAVNARSVRAFETLGFVREGTRRQDYFADGTCWDSHIYGLLREEFTLKPMPETAHRLCLTLRRQDDLGLNRA